MGCVSACDASRHRFYNVRLVEIEMRGGLELRMEGEDSGYTTYLLAKRFPQVGQVNLLVLSWPLSCRFRCSTRLKFLEHWEHWKLELGAASWDW